MTIKRLDHVSVVVDDLGAAIDFFTALGMTLEGEAAVEGPWVDRVNGLDNVQVDIVMMRTPDGHGRLELTKFRNPKLVEIRTGDGAAEHAGPPERHVYSRKHRRHCRSPARHGAELVGEIAQYGTSTASATSAGPAGIIVALAEEIG